jgi:hypothetical protein
VFERDKGCCQYCRLVQIGQAAVFHINHIVPRSHGGTTVESNLVLECPWCSLHKSNKLTGIDATGGELVRLFHPLEQSWNDHLQIDPSGFCDGRTAVGRVTVAELKMNDTLPQIARSIQIQLKLLLPSR